MLQRGNTYHFRIAIPKNLRGHNELPAGTHVQKSLGTSDLGEAKRESLKLANEWRIRFDALSVGNSVKLVGTIRLDKFTNELVRTGSRSDLQEFGVNFFPLIESDDGPKGLKTNFNKVADGICSNVALCMTNTANK